MQSQPELNLTPQAKIKQKQLEALRTPHTVYVNTETGEMAEHKGEELRRLPIVEQWVVPSQRWLERIRHAVQMYRMMLEQHARERAAQQYVLNEILAETRQLTQADVDKLPKPIINPIAEWMQNNPNEWPHDEEDINDVPF